MNGCVVLMRIRSWQRLGSKKGQGKEIEAGEQAVPDADA